MQGLIVAAAITAGVAGPAAQIELDRLLSRVDGRIITHSDVQRATLLRLIEPAGSDTETLRALENRLLILRELERAAPLDPPTNEALMERRAEWESELGDSATAAARLRQSGFSDAMLEAWLRDDLRIRAYLRRLFGMLDEADQARARQEWLARLRQRADLPE